jgi:hypothetical protein
MSATPGPERSAARDEVDDLFDAARTLAGRPAEDERVDWGAVRLRVRRRRVLRTAAWACSAAVLAGAAVWIVRLWDGGAAVGAPTASSASAPVASAPSGVPEFRMLMPGPRVRVIADRDAALGRVSPEELELWSGAVRVAVDSSAGPVPFVVRTPVVRVAVLGTRFGVRHDGAGTAVAVLEGRVRIADAAGAEQTLEAGSEWRAGAAPAALGEAWQADLVRALGAPSGTVPEVCRVASATPAASPPPAPERPAFVVPPVAAPPAAVPGESAPRPPVVPPAEVPSGEALYRQAEAALAAGRLEEAVVLLERVVELERGRTLGGTALIDLAARYQRLGRRAEAAAAYRRYLEEQPGGSFRGEARISLCRLERQAGAQQAARACYAAYLEQEPAGPFAAEATAGAAESGGATQ